MHNSKDLWKKIKFKNTFIYIVLAILALLCLYPMMWLLINSFKTNTELFSNPWGFGISFRWENYANAWTEGNIGRYFINSAFVSIVSVGITIVFSSMAAFAIKRLKWKLSGLVLGFFLLGIMIPIHSTLIPLFMMFSKFRILNTSFSLILPYVTFALPISIFILSGFFGTFPRELEEAAVIDGCSMKRVFLAITLPISKSAIATITIFNFLSMWNELMFAIVFLSEPKKMTLPVGLTNFKGRYGTDWTSMLAAVVITIIPSILVYIFLHDKIIKGVTSGAIKG